MERFSWIIQVNQYNLKSPHEQKAGGSELVVEDITKKARLEWYKEGATRQGVQKVSRRWRQGNKFLPPEGMHPW